MASLFNRIKYLFNQITYSMDLVMNKETIVCIT